MVKDAGGHVLCERAASGVILVAPEPGNGLVEIGVEQLVDDARCVIASAIISLLRHYKRRFDKLCLRPDTPRVAAFSTAKRNIIGEKALLICAEFNGACE